MRGVAAESADPDLLPIAGREPGPEYSEELCRRLTDLSTQQIASPSPEQRESSKEMQRGIVRLLQVHGWLARLGRTGYCAAELRQLLRHKLAAPALWIVVFQEER